MARQRRNPSQSCIIVGLQGWLGLRAPTAPQKQMGPALLPTPLSPARGNLVSCFRPANRLSTLLKARLAPDVSHLSRVSPGFTRRLCLATCPEGQMRVQLPHRRSHRHPTAACRTICIRSRPKPFSIASRSFSEAETACPCGPSFPFAPGFPFASTKRGPDLQPDTSTCFALSSSDPACFGPKPSACHFSDSARTDVNAIFVLKNPYFSVPCGPVFRSFPSRRQVETALESAFRQGLQERVIHFCPDHLWRAVDNSTVHRIGHF